MKKQFELLAGSDNVLNLSQNVINTFKIEDVEKEATVASLKLFLQQHSNHFSVSFLKKQIDNGLQNFDFVYMPKYPLPCTFNVKERRGIINIAIFNKRNILNIDSKDIYTSLLYTYIFITFLYIKKEVSSSENISHYLFALFMRIFGKKYGLVGSYEVEIPKLYFFIRAYVLISFFGVDEKNAYIKAAQVSKLPTNKLNYNALKNYDLTKIRDLIKVLSDSNVLEGLNLYYFTSTMVNRILAHNVCMFEDLSRFFSIIGASSISGNNLCPPNLQFYHKSSYDELLKYVEKITTK